MALVKKRTPTGPQLKPQIWGGHPNPPSRPHFHGRMGSHPLAPIYSFSPSAMYGLQHLLARVAPPPLRRVHPLSSTLSGPVGKLESSPCHGRCGSNLCWPRLPLSRRSSTTLPSSIATPPSTARRTFLATAMSMRLPCHGRCESMMCGSVVSLCVDM